MEQVTQYVDAQKKRYGEPRAGFEEYFKKCKLVPMPTTVPHLAKFYQTPEGLVLHDIMVQPFYDSRTMLARPTDIIVTSYPKTGTTWTQEISYLVAHDADFEKAAAAPTEMRIPFLEIPACGIKAIEDYENPRLIQTHLPYNLLPQSFIDNKIKMIYIARNPRDTVVSYFEFLKMLGYIGYNGSFAEFVDSFCDGQTVYSSFAENVLSYWHRRHEPNILFLFYEDLQRDLKQNVLKVVKFLGKSFTDEQVNAIVEHSTFDNMKKNPMVNYSHGGPATKMPDSKTNFFRKGKIGDWKNYFTPDLLKKVDDYADKHFKGTGLEFHYEG